MRSKKLLWNLLEFYCQRQSSDCEVGKGYKQEASSHRTSHIWWFLNQRLRGHVFIDQRYVYSDYSVMWKPYRAPSYPTECYVKLLICSFWSFVKDLHIHSPASLTRKSCSKLVEIRRYFCWFSLTVSKSAGMKDL